MTNETALRLSIIVFALSIVSLVIVMASFIFHIQIPSGLFRPLMGVGYLWPAAAFAIVWFRKKIAES
jgi:hypothetical protein